MDFTKKGSPSVQAGRDDIVISDETSVKGLVALFVQRGCPDLTSSINDDSCSNFPFAGGGFSHEYRGTMNNGTKIAIKVPRQNARPGDEKAHTLQNTARELYNWSSLKHPNVLPLLGLAVFRGRVSMITEWMENGNLARFVMLDPGVDRIGLCLDVCRGLAYIHASGVIHGDLKAENVLVSPNGTAMVAGFGNSSMEDSTLKFAHETSLGFSLRWAAPELLTEEESRPTKVSDVYAFGMTMLEVLTRKVPYNGITEARIFTMVIIKRETPPRPTAGVSDEIWELLQQCWAFDPSRRPNVRDVEERLFALARRSSVDAGEPSKQNTGSRSDMDREALHEGLWKSPSVAADTGHQSAEAHLPVVKQAATSKRVFSGRIGAKIAVEARAAASNKGIRGLRGITIARTAKFPNEPGMDFVPLVEQEGAEYLAFGAAADIWKISETISRPDNKPEMAPVYQNAVHKVLRVAPLSRELAVYGKKLHHDLWRDFVKDYRSKVDEWGTLKHANVIQVFGIGEGLNLRVEFCIKGSVREYLNSKPISYPHKIDIIVDVMNGLGYMHSRDPPIIHGSLNAGKVFIDGDGTTKIGEFGLALLCYPIAPFVPAVSLVGLSRWLSPEMIGDKDIDTTVEHTMASDIWALGCVLFEIISERVPYSSCEYDMEVQRRVLTGEIPGQRDQRFEEEPFSNLWPLLTACWGVRPEERPSAQEVIARAHLYIPAQ